MFGDLPHPNASSTSQLFPVNMVLQDESLKFKSISRQGGVRSCVIISYDIVRFCVFFYIYFIKSIQFVCKYLICGWETTVFLVRGVIRCGRVKFLMSVSD